MSSLFVLTIFCFNHEHKMHFPIIYDLKLFLNALVMCLYLTALKVQGPFRVWRTSSQGGGMCSDSESAGGSSESRSMDSPTASPGTSTTRMLNKRDYCKSLVPQGKK